MPGKNTVKDIPKNILQIKCLNTVPYCSVHGLLLTAPSVHGSRTPSPISPLPFDHTLECSTTRCTVGPTIAVLLATETEAVIWEICRLGRTGLGDVVTATAPRGGH